MPTIFHGAPTHVLLVHAVVVGIPLTCLAVVLHAFWPTARHRLGIVTPILAAGSLILVPITTHAGELYYDKIGGSHDPLIRKHEELGDELLPYAIGLFVVAVGVWLLGRYLDGNPILPRPKGDASLRTLPTWVAPVVGVVALAMSVAISIQLYRIGDAGARATWHGRV